MRDPRPGDSINALPAICKLAEKYERVNLIMANREIQALADFPPNVKDGMTDEPRGHRIAPVYLLGISEAIGFKIGKDMPHPTTAMIRWCGFECDEVVQPKIKTLSATDDDIPSYEVVFCPWSSDSQRGMRLQQALLTIQGLHGRSIVMFGRREDKFEDDLFDEFNDVDCWPIASPLFIVAVMRKAKVVVTMDSFAGRLAHAAGVRNHLLLLTEAMPYQWASHPDATIVPVKLNEAFDPEFVARAIEEGLQLTPA